MEETKARSGAQVENTAKAIGDLDDLIKAVTTSLPRTKPWQRQLHQYLRDIERRLQVLRMTLAMQRAAEEVVEAAGQLCTALRVAQRYLAAGRADLGTKTAVGFACELGQRVATSLEVQLHGVAGLDAQGAVGNEGGNQSADRSGD